MFLNQKVNDTYLITSSNKHGIWTMEYNADPSLRRYAVTRNRPVRWTQGNIVIEMAYDRMGRRILYHETRNGANYINAKFVYNGYLCIQRLYGASNGVYQSFVWDPTEQVATRPLCMQVPSWGATVFYMHDGNKNVSDVIYYAVANGIAALYDYAPFGAVTRAARDTRMTGLDHLQEYYDNETNHGQNLQNQAFWNVNYKALIKSGIKKQGPITLTELLSHKLRK